MFTPVVFLQINVATKTAIVVDNTAYEPTIDFTEIDVTGTFTVTGPDGVAIVAGATIDLSGGDTESASFNLPLDTTGAILNGSYSLVYVPTFEATNFAVDNFEATADSITIAGVDWTDIFDEAGVTNEVTTTGATAPADNGTFDVISSSLVGSDTVILVDAALTTEDPTSAVISFEVTYSEFVDTTYTYTGCDAAVPVASTPYYCNTTQFGQIIFEDTTVLGTGQTLVSRLWTISYPNGLTNPATPADLTSTQASITINTLATGTWTWLLTLNVSVTQADGLVYTYTATSSATEVVVVCVATLCELFCGMEQLYQQYAQALNGGAQVNEFSRPVSLVNNYYELATLAIECGNQTKFDTYATLIQNTLSNAGVDCNCGCEDESTTEGNHWINNTTQAVNVALAGQSILEVGTPISASGALSPDTSVLPVSTFTNVAVLPSYFQFANELSILGLTEGKKFVNIEYDAVLNAGLSATTTLSISSSSIASILMQVDQLVNVKAKIGTRKSGNDTIFSVQVRSEILELSGSGANVFCEYYEFTNLIDILTNMVVTEAASGANGPNVVVYNVRIYPSAQI